MIRNHEHELDHTGTFCLLGDCEYEIMSPGAYEQHQAEIGGLRAHVVDHLIEEHGVTPELLIPNRSEGHMSSYHAVNHLHLAIHLATARQSPRE